MRELVNTLWVFVAMALALLAFAPTNGRQAPLPAATAGAQTDSAQTDSAQTDSAQTDSAQTDSEGPVEAAITVGSDPLADPAIDITDPSAPLTEVDAPIVVEADHALPTLLRSGSITAAADGAPIDEHAVDAETQAAMERHAEQINTVSDLVDSLGPELPTIPSAASNGGMSAEYDATYAAPSNVRTVVNAAVSRWDAVLATQPSGPVVVEVFWANLGNSSLLGYAGPDGMFFGGGLPAGALYPAPLANTLLGSDVNGSDRPEIQVVLNAELASSGRWYIGTSGSPSTAQIDLYSVVLHEIGHGLGFLGSADVESGETSPSLNSPVFIYDTIATYNGTALTAYGNPAAALVSGNLQANVSSTIGYELYAPSSWSSGSSYSHFDESTYQSGEAGALMTPMLANGENSRSIDSATLGVLAQTGWPLTVKAATPSILTASGSTSSLTVIWAQNLNQTAVAPDSYTVEAWRDGAVLQASTTVAGSSTSATLAALSAGATYTVQVVPTGAGGNGTAAATSLTLPSSGGSGSTSPSYVRYRPLDGQISRLYQAYFLRYPDEAGFDYWVGERASGTPLSGVSDALAASGEFQSRYGSLSNAAFVDLVYGNVLNRAADTEGRAYWISQLVAGVSRGEVMTGFAESNEFIVRTDTAPPTSSTQGKIERLYQAFFLRAPDSAGLAYWIGQADAGVSLEAIATSFTASPEFQTRYGSLNNGSFVSLVYSNVLGRTADAGGQVYWTGQLGTGLDRGAMMVQFSESVEFIKSTGTIP